MASSARGEPQRWQVTGLQGVTDPVGKTRYVLSRVAVVATELIKVMGQTAGANDQHALIAQRLECLAKLPGTQWIERVGHGHLDHRDIRSGQ